MIYLDYTATTPPHLEVLKTFCEVSSSYAANPNSSHKLGREAKTRLDASTQNLSRLLGITSEELIYTSGASEANNLAIKGIASTYKKHGRHIISTYLEHSSVTGPLTALQNAGYEIDFVDILDNGLVNIAHLKELLRQDTILVSIGYVDSELGVKQPIEEIGAFLANYPHCFFHVDATQAIGKIPVSLKTVDLMTFTAHKFYGLNGCGALIKKEKILLEPLIHGGKSISQFRSGTPSTALIAAAEKALELSLENHESSLNYVSLLNQKLREGLKACPMIHINSSIEAVPYILNMSVRGMNTVGLQEALEGYEIYVSTKSACCAPNTPSRPVYALTKDRKLALSTLRVSLSHLTTLEELDIFLECFESCYKKLAK